MQRVDDHAIVIRLSNVAFKLKAGIELRDCVIWNRTASCELGSTFDTWVALTP